MRRVAVLGGTGQLGTDLVRVLREDAGEVVPLGHGRVECADPDSVRGALSAVRPDVVINCAAFVRVDECEDRPAEAFGTNALGALHVARTCLALGAVCVHISTDYVFNGLKGEPYTEDDLPDPLNVYGTSKLAGEYFVRNVCPRHFVVRTSGLYGIAGSSGKGGNFVETMIRQAAEGRPIRVVCDQTLTPTYTRELARKIQELVQTDAYGLYHITNSGHCSWYEFAREIFRVLGLTPDFGPTTAAEFGRKARRPAYSVLGHNKLRALRLPPLRPWPEALGAYLRERSDYVSSSGLPPVIRQ